MRDEKTTGDQLMKGLGEPGQWKAEEENSGSPPATHEKELIHSEERYRRLVELSPDIVLLHSRGKYMYVNPAAVKIFGATGPEDLIGKEVLEIIHPEYWEIAIDQIKQLEEGKEVPLLEEKYLRLDGTTVDLEVAAAPTFYQGQPVALVVARDITEQKRAQEAIHKSEEKYRAIFETTGAGTVIIEDDLTISLVNTEFERFSGYTRGDVEGKKRWIEFFLPEDLEKLKEYHRLRTINPDWAPRSYESRFVNKTGKVLEVLVTVGMIPGTKKSVGSFLDITLLKRAEGAIRRLANENAIIAEISRIIGSTLNIEEVYERFAQEVRKLIQRAEEALRASEEKYRTLVENATEAIFVVQDEKIKFPNRKTLSLSGYSAEELSQIPFTHLIHPDDQEAIMERYRREDSRPRNGRHPIVPVPQQSRGRSLGADQFGSHFLGRKAGHSEFPPGRDPGKEAGSSISDCPKDGGHRDLGRRHRPRLQQFAHGDSRIYLFDPLRPRPRSSPS